jgi:CHAT domain-containing protein
MLLEPELRGEASKAVRVNADGWLATIPLGALTDASGQYAARRWWFVESYGSTPDARHEVAEDPIGPKSRALIVVAPSGVVAEGVRAGFLTAAMPEAQNVAGRFSVGILKESPAGERLQDLAADAEVFHFVGHGWANGGGGALLLGSEAEGGSFWTARNLAAQDWSRCRLAVLSACLTATGAERGIVNNESLVQALLSGGARRIVAARWSVDSEATRSLMEGFYDELLRGQPVAAALARSAKTVAEQPLWRHPYYWAAFDVFGRM